MKRSQLKLAIEETIEYAKKHGGGLSLDQLYERLISRKEYKKKEIQEFVRKKKITFNKKKENEFYKEKIKKVDKLVKEHFSKFKTILMVGVSGSVAGRYPKKNDDIDLVIITKGNTLWLTRLGWKIYSLLKRIPERRYGEKEEKDEFCFNMWLDQKSLRLPVDKQNLKSAVDLILMKPILDKEDIYNDFLAENDWAKKYVANGYRLKVKGERVKGKEIRNKNYFIAFLNWIAFIGQYVYMRKKIEKEKVGIHFAFFHRN